MVTSPVEILQTGQYGPGGYSPVRGEFGTQSNRVRRQTPLILLDFSRIKIHPNTALGPKDGGHSPPQQIEYANTIDMHSRPQAVCLGKLWSKFF